MNVYLAGPEVFLPNSGEVLNKKIALARAAGFDPLAGIVIEDDVDLLLLSTRADYLTKEVHKLIAGVPGGRLALDLACAHVERGI